MIETKMARVIVQSDIGLKFDSPQMTNSGYRAIGHYLITTDIAASDITLQVVTSTAAYRVRS